MEIDEGEEIDCAEFVTVTGACEDCLEQPRPKESSKIPNRPTIFIELRLGLNITIHCQRL